MAPDHAFKYNYEWRESDGTLKGTFEFIAFFWENRVVSLEMPYKNDLSGLLVLYIRDEHGHEYELADFPEAAQESMKAALRQYLTVDRFVL